MSSHSLTSNRYLRALPHSKCRLVILWRLWIRLTALYHLHESHVIKCCSCRSLSVIRPNANIEVVTVRVRVCQIWSRWETHLGATSASAKQTGPSGRIVTSACLIDARPSGASANYLAAVPLIHHVDTHPVANWHPLVRLYPYQLPCKRISSIRVRQCRARLAR